MISSTSITSTNGVVLISAIGCASYDPWNPPKAIMPLAMQVGQPPAWPRVPRPRPGSSDTDGQTWLISVRGSDLKLFLGGELSREDALKRVSVRVF